jgi:hypothetical protein
VARRATGRVFQTDTEAEDMKGGGSTAAWNRSKRRFDVKRLNIDYTVDI